MGCEPQRFPSDAVLKDWTPTDAGTAVRKWKKKLRTSFGVSEIGAGRQPIARRAPEAADPSKVLLPQTLKNDSGDFDYLDGDLTEEWARQIRELSKAETKSSTPRLDLATHLPLGNIKPYFGLRNKSEKSMQWLRTFIYEMKGTNTPPNEWCMAFELSLQGGALHWYRQLPRKTRRTWKLLSDAFIKCYCSRFTQSVKARYYSAKREDKEHVCDYLNRLNGYAPNAGVQFENTKDHVEHFLDTCDDRGLEERLCHVRVKDIHDLEDMVNDILRRRERKTSRESSGRRPKNQEDNRRHDGRRTEGSRDSYRRDQHDRERRRDDSRPRATVANALTDLVAALNVNDATRSRSNRPETRHHGYDSTETSSEDERHRDGSRCSSESSDSDSSPDGEYGHVAAANDSERRAAAEGTFARSDHRHPRSGNCHFNKDRGYGRDNRQRQCGSPPTETGLVPIGLPQLTEPAIDADYMFAFAGEVNWPEDREITIVKTMENEKER
ncbi:Hypothetical protein PHPALM_19113, partial [Phytophthora palmivora]